ncbi:MAG: RNA polymerase subunit sigma-24 [Dyadobacter sp. 50-39]|uniref:RNA polymerase sigma factor n=1 Tax=Dyadobacter sp. 50-39 TaxID=1895756 RepID=UPI00095F2222|nr:sigma-70 family RNA polymerase sigma factor [Dyadobacter sp. 50-39]OJV22559.1 MAG: RNA polymerase subunit sigma-24 [Dyadobacter sp. 50-39]
MDQKEPHQPTDRLLVERVLHGNTRAFGAIIKRTEGLITQIVFRMIADKEQRADVAQDIYLKVFQKLASFRFESKLSTWIARIAYNTCINQLDKNKTAGLTTYYDVPAESEDDHFSTLDQIADLADPESDLFQTELTALLQSEIERLPAVYKLLITLYHQQELSYGEIGQIVALPEGTIKSYLFRARKMLKERLQIIYQKGL